ncbi:hypothetical protein N8I77_009036 [Diaporthe amygdali]|uniref:F-box domain-containing protein n=1 Tax=Phomopsis amygdali TaxID=1214568 RepID=A0AAD9W0H1_PHOAM|nr:hypothetical protein N8I77_009036 [Diaporthe amygdali]
MYSLSPELWHMVATYLSIEDAKQLRLASRFFADIAGAHILPIVTFHMNEDDLSRLRGIADNGVLAPNVKSLTYFTRAYESPAVPLEEFTRHHETSVKVDRLTFGEGFLRADPVDDRTMEVEYEKYKLMVDAQDRIRDGMTDLACLKDTVAKFTGLKQVIMSSGNVFYEGCAHGKLSPFLGTVPPPTQWPRPEGVRHLEVMLEALVHNNHSVDSLCAGTLDWRFFDKSPTELARLFQPVLNAVQLELELCLDLDENGNDILGDTEKCRQFMERGTLRGVLKTMKKLDTLRVVFHGDLGMQACPALLKDVIDPSHHWPNLTYLELCKVECDRHSLMQLLELHKDTLQGLCLSEIDLGETSWKKLLPDIRNNLDLEDVCICGTLAGRPEDTTDEIRWETWDLSMVGVWENDMRASINCYCRNNGRDYPDELPLTEEVVQKYFERYVRCHVKCSEAEDVESTRQAEEDMRRRQREAGLIPLIDSESDSGSEGSGISLGDYFWDEDEDEDEDDNDNDDDDERLSVVEGSSERNETENSVD